VSRTERVVPAKGVLAIVLLVLGVVGLVIAARLPADGGYWTGLAIFLLSLAGLFLVIKRHFDAIDHDPAVPKHPRFAEKTEMVMPPAPSVSAFIAERGTELPPSTQTQVSSGGLLPGGWLLGIVLVVVALAALFVAAGASGFLATVAMVVFVLAVLGLFRQIGADPAGPALRLVPGSGSGRWLAGIGGVVLFILALLVASAGSGTTGDLALIVALDAVAYVFLLIKAAYDRPAA